MSNSGLNIPSCPTGRDAAENDKDADLCKREDLWVVVLAVHAIFVVKYVTLIRLHLIFCKLSL